MGLGRHSGCLQRSIRWVLPKIVARGIEPATVRAVVFSDEADVIEGEEEPESTACLVYGRAPDGRILHVSVAIMERLKVTTAYDPSLDTKGRWEPDFKTRRRRSEDDHGSVPGV